LYCPSFGGKVRGCSLDECCCAEEKLEAIMREYGLGREDAEQIIAENRGKDLKRILAESGFIIMGNNGCKAELKVELSDNFATTKCALAFPVCAMAVTA
jgi:anti-sigma regulatory factor (Ser/Thr protein kinase)